MSDEERRDEDFLARWSRRKLQSRATVESSAPAEAADPSNPPPAAAQGAAPDEVDLSSLPAIESITGATDITAFLRKGVPQELSREALRRAWAADPAIRDFIGLAENAWDFNDPHAMPGFGPLECSEEQLAELVDRIVGGVRRIADDVAAVASEKGSDSQTEPADNTPPLDSKGSEVVAGDAAAVGKSPAVPVAAQPKSPEAELADTTPMRRRTHGSALPK